MSFLDTDLLARIHERAADADAANTYPEADLADLREAGYLRAFVPTEFGGAGLSLTEIAAEQTALAKAAPGTALGINMHQIIVGLGRYLVAAGNARGEQILRDAAAGEVFGFGISEPGNDLVLFGSTTQATATADGGYSFEGTKIFTSLSPVWTRLLIFGRAQAEEGPKSVFGIVRRDDDGYSITDDWNTLGMRATQSMTTLLQGVTVPEERILTITDPGPSADPVIFGIFSHFEILLAATYQGVGERAVEVAAENRARGRKRGAVGVAWQRAGRKAAAHGMQVARGLSSAWLCGKTSRAGAQAGVVGHELGCLPRGLARSERAEGARSVLQGKGRRDLEPRVRFVRQDKPRAVVRTARPAIVRRVELRYLAQFQDPRFEHGRGFIGLCALSQVRHLGHALSRFRGREVLAHACAEIGRGSDVEDVAGGADEPVDAGGAGDSLRQARFLPPRLGNRVRRGCEVLQMRHSERPEPAEHRVQNVHGGPGVVKGSMARRRRRPACARQG